MKSYLDYGAYTPIQVAAAAALNGPQECVEEMRQTYRPRRDVLVEASPRPGGQIPSPSASMFAWAPLPEKFRASRLGGVLQAADGSRLRSRSRLALGFGEYGDGYMRIGLVENEQRIRQAARNLKQWLTTSNVAP